MEENINVISRIFQNLKSFSQLADNDFEPVKVQEEQRRRAAKAKNHVPEYRTDHSLVAVLSRSEHSRPDTVFTRFPQLKSITPSSIETQPVDHLKTQKGPAFTIKFRTPLIKDSQTPVCPLSYTGNFKLLSKIRAGSGMISRATRPPPSRGESPGPIYMVGTVRKHGMSLGIKREQRVRESGPAPTDYLVERSRSSIGYRFGKPKLI